MGSGVLLVLGGMSRGAGRTQSDCDGMFLMNLRLNKDKKMKASGINKWQAKWNVTKGHVKDNFILRGDQKVPCLCKETNSNSMIF